MMKQVPRVYLESFLVLHDKKCIKIKKLSSTVLFCNISHVLAEVISDKSVSLFLVGRQKKLYIVLLNTYNHINNE